MYFLQLIQNKKIYNTQYLIYFSSNGMLLYNKDTPYPNILDNSIFQKLDSRQEDYSSQH